MDGSNLNNSDIYFGKVDDEEDDDAFAAYGISIDKIKNQPETKISEVAAFNSGLLAVNIGSNKTKRTKKKNVVSAPNLIQTNDSKVQEVEFPSNQNHTSESVNLVKPEVEEPKYKPNEQSCNMSASQNRTVPDQLLFNNQTSVPSIIQRQFGFYPSQNSLLVRPNVSINMTGQQLLHNNQMMMLNNQLMMGNQPRLATPPNLDHVTNQNYSLTSTYNNRLRVIDTLFRFIMQILQTPEQPQVQQIEFLKQMLDSLVVTKPTETYGKKQ